MKDAQHAEDLSVALSEWSGHGPKAPATPLPWMWGWRRDDQQAPGSVYHMKLPGHAYAVAMCPQYGKPNFKKDGPYIVHTANAYPRLISMVRLLLAHEVINVDDAAEDLLRELGEDIK